VRRVGVGMQERHGDRLDAPCPHVGGRRFNRGFRDLLLIGRQDRPSLFDLDDVRPPPLVPQEPAFVAVVMPWPT
jgi:hypothetical protein